MFKKGDYEKISPFLSYAERPTIKSQVVYINSCSAQPAFC